MKWLTEKVQKLFFCLFHYVGEPRASRRMIAAFSLLKPFSGLSEGSVPGARMPIAAAHSSSELFVQVAAWSAGNPARGAAHGTRKSQV